MPPCTIALRGSERARRQRIGLVMTAQIARASPTRSAPRRLTMRMVEPTVVPSRLGWARRNFASSPLSETASRPNGLRAVGACSGCYQGVRDGISSGSASHARARTCPRCRLRCGSTGIRCWRRRPIGARDADGRCRTAAREPRRWRRGDDSRLAPGLGRHHALPSPRDGLRPRGLAAGRRPSWHQERDFVAPRRAASAGCPSRARSRTVRQVRAAIRPGFLE